MDKHQRQLRRRKKKKKARKFLGQQDQNLAKAKKISEQFTDDEIDDLVDKLLPEPETKFQRVRRWIKETLGFPFDS